MPDSQQPGMDLTKRSPSLEHPIRRPVPGLSIVRELSR
jgi:hypothetical protein